MPWDLGIQVSKICADFEKHLKQTGVQTELKKEYLKTLKNVKPVVAHEPEIVTKNNILANGYTPEENEIFEKYI